nr:MULTISPECIES: hypothetical protein [unclassified Acidithiobacillus]
MRTLSDMELRNLFVFTKRDMEKMFPNETDKAMGKSLQRMVKDQLLIKAARGIYVYAPALMRNGGRVIESVARALRPGQLSYVSLESLLSEYGLISQVPVSYLTVMTTGASGLHKTPFGTIEFTHTKRSIPEVLERTIVVEGRPLRIAKKRAAVQDLYRVGRNTDMIDLEELDDTE